MSRTNRLEGSRAVTVPATTAPSSTTPITASCRLMGWSLAAGLGSGKYQEGTVTSPAALAVIANFGTVAADEYTLNWQVELGGAAAAADANNFGVYLAGVLIATSINPGAAGLWPQEPVQILVPAGGATVTISAIGLGTVGIVYTAAGSLTGGAPMEATLYDSGQAIGQSAAPQGFADTQIMTDDGIYVSTSIKVTAVDGTVSGVLYVRDAPDYPVK